MLGIIHPRCMPIHNNVCKPVSPTITDIPIWNMKQTKLMEMNLISLMAYQSQIANGAANTRQIAATKWCRECFWAENVFLFHQKRLLISIIDIMMVAWIAVITSFVYFFMSLRTVSELNVSSLVFYGLANASIQNNRTSSLIRCSNIRKKKKNVKMATFLVSVFIPSGDSSCFFT